MTFFFDSIYSRAASRLSTKTHGQLHDVELPVGWGYLLINKNVVNTGIVYLEVQCNVKEKRGASTN